MLEILIDSDTIIAVQRQYRERGTLAGTAAAASIDQWHAALRHGVRRFGERQRAAHAATRPLMQDARIETLERDVFGPMAKLAWPRGWPTRVNAILQGLQIADPTGLPSLVPATGGRSLADRDPESYFAILYDGPPQERTFGALAGLTFYIDPLKRLQVLWIGLEADLDDAWSTLLVDTRSLTDWSVRSPLYQRWIGAYP